jgi:hypothetical protein
MTSKRLTYGLTAHQLKTHSTAGCSIVVSARNWTPENVSGHQERELTLKVAQSNSSGAIEDAAGSEPELA